MATGRDPVAAVELVGAIIANFDRLDNRRKRCVNVRELVERLREAIQ